MPVFYRPGSGSFPKKFALEQMQMDRIALPGGRKFSPFTGESIHCLEFLCWGPYLITPTALNIVV